MAGSTKSADASKSKTKLVRDSFTMPKLEYAQIAGIKQRAAKLGQPVKKSEVLRAAIAVLSRYADKDLLAALAAVPSLKTGRPKAEPKSVPGAVVEVKKPAAVAKKAAAKKAPVKKVAAKKVTAKKAASKAAVPSKA
ncbi:MAG: hypothetical protein KGN37_06955 [Burkholderiales bacterium]|nr:hypothetical protein [Burkholderiales bacterium]